MKILITGSSGRVGTRLMKAIPTAFGLDTKGSPDYLRDILEGPLPACDLIIHLAGLARPDGRFEEYSETLRLATHVIDSGAPVIFASSVWADLGPINAYATTKLAIERMVDLAGGLSIRVGWVGYTKAQYDAGTDWLRSVAWTDEKLADEFRSAVTRLGLPKRRG